MTKLLSNCCNEQVLACKTAVYTIDEKGTLLDERKVLDVEYYCSACKETIESLETGATLK